MARKKADEARDTAESGDDRAAVLTDDRPDATGTSDETGGVSLGKRADETDDADETTATTRVEDDDTDGRDLDEVDDTDDEVDDTDDEVDDTDDEHDDVVDDTDDELDDDLDDEDDDDSRNYVGKGTFLATLGVAVVAVLGALFLLGAFVWPAFLGPGSPDGTASTAVSALGAKDQGRLAEVSCVKLDGQPAAAFPPELLALIGNAAPSGPATQTLESEARQPIDLTLTQGGQSQTLPADLLFAVNDGDWCLNGISQRQ